MTGVFQTGKTTWINTMLPQAFEQGVDVQGVYTPAIFEGDTKTGIAATLLPSMEHFCLATKRPFEDCDMEKGKLGWIFDEQRIEQINAHLATCTDAQLLIIDELGPMEMLRNEGYTEGLALLDNRQVQNALLVVRPSLLDAARERWGEFETLTPESSIDEFLSSL